MLEQEFEGSCIIDDGLPLRKALPILTGIGESLPFTQEGKATVHTIGMMTETVREGLGELGNYLEDRYGEEIIAELAINYANKFVGTAPFCIYPSVRKTQGFAYRDAGGIVIEVRNPKCGDSGNEFDRWDPDTVDYVIQNDPSVTSLDDLRQLVRKLPTVIWGASRGY